MDEERKEDVQPETIPQTEQTPQELTTEEKSMGPVLGSIIVVIILVVAAFYVWNTGISQNEVIMEVPEIVDTTTIQEIEIGNDAAVVPDTATEVLNTLGTSDEIADIEADLAATDLSNLDAELDEIDLLLQ